MTTFLLDGFSGRGINNTINDQSHLDSLAMMVDAFRVLDTLAQHSRIDPNGIAVMGFSKGAIAAVYSSNERFRKMYGPPNVQFAAHIGLYTPCDVTYNDDDKVTWKPLHLFHGIADSGLVRICGWPCLLLQLGLDNCDLCYGLFVGSDVRHGRPRLNLEKIWTLFTKLRRSRRHAVNLH